MNRNSVSLGEGELDSAGVRRQMSLTNSKKQGDWLHIQRNTFTNWVNEGLRGRGVVISDIRTGFSDGVNLVALVEALTRHKIQGAVAKPSNEYQKLENITVALDTVKKDGVKIVNIGTTDIFSGDLKLVLALVWQLVLKYQIGLSSAQNKSWILLWLQAVIPDCNIRNLTTDWNDGTALHALLDYCKPGLSPNWQQLDRTNALDNCRSAMKLAVQNFNIPLILRPEDLSSPDLDERSAITYLSYFTRVGGPGYDATLQRVSARTQPKVVNNFTTDWQDGQALVNLVRSAGGKFPDEADVSGGPVALIEKALKSGGELGIERTLTAEQISQENIEHLGMMAYTAQYVRQPYHQNYNTPGTSASYTKHETSYVITKKSTPEGHLFQSSSHDLSQSNHGFGDHSHRSNHYGSSHPYDTSNDETHYSRSYNTVEIPSSFRHYNTVENSSSSRHYNGEFSSGLFNGDHNPYVTSLNVTQPLRVRTTYPDDDVLSTHASTIASNPPTSPPIFHLVRKSSMHGPRVEIPGGQQLKVDIYSVGVIIESKMTGVFDPEKFKVEAIAPTGRVIKITGDGHYAAQFNAEEIGRWKVSMYYDGRFMDGCPIDVCDPSQVKVRELQGSLVGKSNTFYVDCTKAGPGDLGVDISHNGRPVTAHISPTSTHAYKKVTFLPYEAGAYAINVHFNRAEVRETDSESFNPDERQRKAVFYTRVEPHKGYIEVKASCDWEIDYITGSPYICHVTDSSDIAVYGMEDGTVCANPELIADCTKVGDGQVDAEVTYNGQRYPCRIKRSKPCVYRVQFKPRGPGIYKIWINYEGRPVKGSPFVQEIAELEKPKASGDGLHRGVPGKPAVFLVDTRGFPGQISVAVNGPSKPVSCQLEALPNNTIKGTYYPTERGPHTIHILLDGKDIEESPFHPLVVDPVSVRVSGGWRPLLDETGVIPLRVNKEKHLPFDVSEAGPGELTAEVQGPNGKIPVTIDARNDGKHSVIFTPREEGRHNIHVYWGGYPLSNSPYLGIATHEPEVEPPHVRMIHVPVQPVETYSSPKGSVAGSFVDGPIVNVHRNNPEPYRHPENEQPELHFRPVEPDRPQELVYHVDQPQTRVRVLPVNAEKHMRPKYEEPDHDEPRRIEEPKRIESPVPQPDHVKLMYEDPKPKKKKPTVVEVKVTEPDRVVAEPARLVVRNVEAAPPPKKKTPPSSPRAPQKVILSGRGLKEAEVNKPARFTVDGTQADPGKPSARLQGVNNEIPIKIEQAKPQVYKCSYVPKKPGAYLLYTNWNDKPLKGSPFKVNVTEPVQPDQVIVTTDPRNGPLGRDLDMRIDTRNAGPGKLAVKCTDPNGQNVPCRLNDNLDGTRSLKLTPTIPGQHIVEILYNDNHIKGSPYAINIKASQIKGAVRVWGPGIENGIIPHFQSTFWVETTGAGSGDLRVRIMGPKGAFHVKMRRASQKDKIYQCFYDPVEPGIYTVNVQWSGDHVEGSPFTVLLATSAMELQMMQDEVHENSTILEDNSAIMRQRSQNSTLRPQSIDNKFIY